MKKYLIVLALGVIIWTPSARADCLPGAPGCDLQATTQAQCTAVGGSWMLGQCIGATGVTPGTTPIGQNLLQQGSNSGVNLGVLRQYSTGIIDLINTILVPVLIAIAFIVFLWGAFKYFIWHGENETEKAEGRKYAMWGIIGFVVIFSLWAFVNIVRAVFNLTTNAGAPTPPTI